MRKFISKIAFTIAEMLVVLIIIGIVTVITIHSIKHKNQAQYSKLYNTAYNALQQSVFDALTNYNQPTGLDCTPSADNEYLAAAGQYYGTEECWNTYTTTEVRGSGGTYERWASGGIEDYPRAFPGFLFGSHIISNLDGFASETRFCESIAKNINTLSESNQCKSFLYARADNDSNWLRGEDFDKIFCATKLKDDGTGTRKYLCDETAGKINPSFIAANGQQFYISPIVFANPPYYPPSIRDGASEREIQEANKTAAKLQKTRMAFRLVAVDLNGASGPNTQLKKGNALPDIVLFAITAQGQVIPLGLPELNPAYFEAKVNYPKYLGEDPSNPGHLKKNDKNYSDAMSLFDAKAVAWYGTLIRDEWLKNYFGQAFMPSQPFSYSNVFYYWGIKCKGPNGCVNKEGMSNHFYADKILANLVYQFIYSPDNLGDDYADNGNTVIPRDIDGEKLDQEHGCVFGSAPNTGCSSTTKPNKYCCILIDK